MSDDALLAMSPNDDLRRLIAAYRASLTPDANAMAVLRAGLVARAAAGATDGATEAARTAPRRTHRPLAAARERRLAAGLLAAGIGTAAIVGGAAAAQPGGLLYGPRLWAETVTLPREPEARVEADLHRLDARLADARAAAAASDVNGARAALEAFGAVVDDALVGAGSDGEREQRVALGLERRRDALSALRPAVAASTADDTLRGLIDRTNAAIDRLGGGDEPARGKPPNANPGNAGGNAGNGNGDAGGDDDNGKAGGNGSGNGGGGNAASDAPPSGSNADGHGPSDRPNASHSAASPAGRPDQTPH
ncbi:MAG TPA: hypothetical protein VFI28_02300 [Candidatus Limnocylindrales bacterium]|nr:hypothetical protein [Candidatus Limnocylindrales bacterium]